MGKSSSKERRLDSSVSYVNSQENVLEEIPNVHGGPIHSLCAPNKDNLISGGASKIVTVYHWPEHIVKNKLSGPQKDVTKVNYSPANRLIQAGSRDHVIYGWRWPKTDPRELSVSVGTPSSRPDLMLRGHTLGVTALASSESHPDVLCSGSRDNSVCLWDIEEEKCISSLALPRNLVTGLCWLESEMAVLQSSEDKTVRVWDLRTSSIAQQFHPKQNVQTCCAVYENGNYFLSGSSGSGRTGAELTLWDRREGKIMREYSGHTESVQGCLFLTYKDPGTSRLSDLIASCGSDSTVRLWQRDDGSHVHSEYLAGAGPITSIVSPANGMLACSSFHRGVLIWNLGIVNRESGIFNLNLRSTY